MEKPRYHNVSISKIALIYLNSKEIWSELYLFTMIRIHLIVISKKMNFVSIPLLLSRVLLGYIATKQI